MFVWECLQSEGRHIGMCVDTFMFGSCCAPPGAPRPPGAAPQDTPPSDHSPFAPPKKKPPPPYHHDVTMRPPGELPYLQFNQHRRDGAAWLLIKCTVKLNLEMRRLVCL